MVPQKKVIDKTKNGENVPSREVVEAVVVQCDLVDNQYQQKSEVLYTFTPNKFCAYLLNDEPSNLLFLKTYNTEFDEIIVIFMNQNGKPLEIEDKVNLTFLLINRNDTLFELSNATIFYRTKQEQENMLKNVDFYHLLENIKNNYWIQDALKSASKKVVH